MKLSLGEICVRDLQCGIDLLSDSNYGRCALLCNQSSLNHVGERSSSIAKNILQDKLVALYVPQHGYWGTEQDNMIETPDGVNREGLPVYSLYSEVRTPSVKMLSSIDTIIVDLQIVGCRVYTFKTTIYNCLKVAKKFNKKIVVLDRPNPLGGNVVEGPVLEEDLKSFVGPYPTPLRHALTIAEIALLFNKSFSADLEVVKMKGWDPKASSLKYFPSWTYTSPNLPTLESVLVYYAMVLFEGTNLSEGRGTCLPFQLVGAPYVKNPSDVIAKLNSYNPNYSGVRLREIMFRPTFGKWMGEICKGVHLQVVPGQKVNIFPLAVGLLRAFAELSPKDFSWKNPPYEYEYETSPIKMILGKKDARESLLEKKLDDPYWTSGLVEYIDKANSVLLYERKLECQNDLIK
jgi:uncharacterized protein YbbC (DUF1343 family)